MKKILFLLFTIDSTIAFAQQINGVFTDFAKNNQWGSTAINSVKVETNGNITLSGWYQCERISGFDNSGNYYNRPNKSSHIVRLNSSGNILESFGFNGGASLTYVNSAYGSSTIDRSHQLSDGAFLHAGHYDNGRGYLTKCFSATTGTRPTAFNGGNAIVFPSPSYTRKTYIEDWAVAGSTSYVASMDGLFFNAQKVIVSAYNNTTGALVSSFGNNGTIELRDSLTANYLRDSMPIKMARDSDGRLYVGFTRAATSETDEIILYRINSNGILDSAFGNTVGIGFASFAVPRPYCLTSLVLMGNGTITMGGFHATADGTGLVSFRNYNPTTQAISSTAFNVPPGNIGVGAGCKTTAAVLDNIAGTERVVFTVAFPFEANRYRIFIAAYQPGSAGSNINFTPWQYPGAISAEPTDIARQSNGSFIVAGNMIRPNGTSVGVVIKYNTDGTIDNSFGEQGSFLFNIRDRGPQWIDATQLSNGKYMAVGGTQFVPDEPEKKALLLSRFNSDGSIDTSFGTNGTLYPYKADYPRNGSDVVALENGQFFVTGTYYNYSNEPGLGSIESNKAALYKFNADGSPDNSFGPLNNGRYYNAAANSSFGKMLITGDAIYLSVKTSIHFIQKLSPEGNFIATYAGGFSLIQDYTLNETTGYLYTGGSRTGVTPKQICKFNPSGMMDSSFGTGGYASIPIMNTGDNNNVRGLKLAPGNKLLVTVHWASSGNANYGVFFSSISDDGVVDMSFGTNGAKLLQLPGATQIIAYRYKWVGQNSDNLMVFGQATVNGATRGFVCKVDLNGDIDPLFGTNGVIWTTETFLGTIGFDNNGNALAIKYYTSYKGTALQRLQIPADVYNRIKTGSWTGTIDSDWFKPGNWAEGVVPDAFTEVVIDGGSVIIGANQHAYAYSVRVLNGASLTMGANSSIEVSSQND